MISLQKGDCLELMKAIPDGSVDMVLCDLPYQKVNGRWEYMLPLPDLWREYERVVKPNGAIVLHAPMYDSLDEEFLSACPTPPRHTVSWNDGTHYRKCYVFYREKPVHNKAKLALFTEKIPPELKRFACEDPAHPFYFYQSPVSAMDLFIRTYTNAGDTVLDNCMGTGSTGVGCVISNRNFIGMEIWDKHFEISRLRIEKYSDAMNSEEEST